MSGDGKHNKELIFDRSLGIFQFCEFFVFVSFFFFVVVVVVVVQVGIYHCILTKITGFRYCE